MQVRAADFAPVQLDLDVVVLVDLALRDVLDADVPALYQRAAFMRTPLHVGCKPPGPPP